MEPTIRLYAELLLHIRSVTLQGSVRSYTASESVARLFTDGNIITVSYEGVKASIELPAKAIGSAAAEVTIPAGEPRELSSRLQVDGDISNLLTLGYDDANDLVPWSAPSLSTDCTLCCQRCGGTIVPRSKLSTWKDLPSANWAEMMDFWHCHKPAVPVANGDDSGAASSNKGYAAGSRVSAVGETGLVDLTTFLISPDDCMSVKVDKPDKTSKAKPEVQCQFCRTTLGIVDELASGYRLQKWRMAIFFSDSVAAASYSAEKWLATMLLTTAENTSVRKFTVRIKEGAKLIWLFSPDLYFCASTSDNPSPSKAVRAAKILWKNISLAEYDTLEKSSSYEDLDLSPDLAAALFEILTTNQELLPLTMREFDGWDVTLLARFSLDDVKDVPGRGSSFNKSDTKHHNKGYPGLYE